MKMMFKILVLVAIFSPCWTEDAEEQPATALLTKPPAFIHICYKDEPDFAECAKTMLNGLPKAMVNGIPELGVKPIEPLTIDQLDDINLAGFRLRLSNIVAHGVSNITVGWARGPLTTEKREFEGRLDQVQMSGNYEVSSYFWNLPIFLLGRVESTVSDIRWKAVCQTSIVNRDGVDFFSVDALDLKFTAGSAVGNVWLGEQRLHVISQVLSTPFNSWLVINALAGGLQETFRKIAFDFANRLFSSVPYDVIIPDHRPVDDVEG